MEFLIISFTGQAQLIVLICNKIPNPRNFFSFNVNFAKFWEFLLLPGTGSAPSGLQKVGWIFEFVLDLEDNLLSFPQKLCVVLGKRRAEVLVVP